MTRGSLSCKSGMRPVQKHCFSLSLLEAQIHGTANTNRALDDTGGNRCGLLRGVPQGMPAVSPWSTVGLALGYRQ